ncbi:metallophosphoesterase family protein [Echinicola shivajiensis]|uniref:metallophosphoesterase family protein n=1 Tax=Echinicola shivajiensis TaxID=1035916 RepID=UPI001BFC3547|nr:metallophosphoesterase [Echinicola shivajiensis]
MKRRKFLMNSTTAVAAFAAPAVAIAKEVKEKPVLTIAHITDVHIRPEDDIPNRALTVLNEVKNHQPDFFLNGGDSIHDASYDGTSRDRVLEQWAVWDDFISEIGEYNVYSCIGNHDPWWDTPKKEEDEMYGLEYVVKRLQIPHRYYSFSKNGWHFIVLDGNHKNITLDDEQWNWLENELESLNRGTPVLLMSHYPILTVTGTWEGGQHGDHGKLKELFYKHKDKVKVCLSGHQHLLDRAWYNGVHYFCNGALSGFWWGTGNERSASEYFYQETPPGYAILKLYKDGTVVNEYYPLV